MPNLMKPVCAAALLVALFAGCSESTPPAQAAEPAAAAPEAATVKRYPIPDSTFPIALAVEVPASSSLVFLSGQTPVPADPEAEEFSAAYWGDTEAQSLSVLGKIDEALKSTGLTMSDVVKMQAFLVGTPDTGKMDFAGFMKAYTQYFGTETQSNLPARTTVQIAALGRPGMLVEIEVIAVRP